MKGKYWMKNEISTAGNLIKIIEDSRNNALKKVNEELIRMYWNVGEYLSDFYLEALDRQKKKENENPSVGMILCASKDDEVVEYAMSRTLSPMMVAEYKLQLPDKAVLQKKLQELINMPLIEE